MSAFGLELEFTPLEFETLAYRVACALCRILEFTPLEFETSKHIKTCVAYMTIRIYSVGV